MKSKLLIAFLLLLVQQATATHLIDSVEAYSGTVLPKYAKFEIGIMATNIPTNVLNPYSDTINIYAIFTSPTGTKYKRDAFWYVDYHRCNTCPNPTRPTGQDSCYSYIDAPELEAPHPDAYLSPQPNAFPWRVRFAPDATGKMERSFLLDTEKFSLQSPVKTNLDFCEQRTH